MEVKNIIKKVCNLMGDAAMVAAIDAGSFTEDQRKDLNLLVECVNLTNTNIATNYVKLFDTATVNNYSGKVQYSAISNNAIFNIVGIKNDKNKDVDFTLNQSGIYVEKGVLKIRFTYFPKGVDFDDEITNYPTKISERDLVYGTLSEYLYAKGVFDEAQMWEERFKLEMQSKARVQKQINMKVSRWT